MSPRQKEEAPREHLGVPLLRLHDQGDQDHPGTTDMLTMKKWKGQVRGWVAKYTNKWDCSAFQNRPGAVPNEPSRVSEATQRSEQFLGWCVAYYADEKRGRWQKWTLTQRVQALQLARELTIKDAMMNQDGHPASKQIMSRIQYTFSADFPMPGPIP